MNVFTDTRSGQKESPSEYMRKVFKVTGYALSVNKVLIVLMLVASLLVLVINFNAGGSYTAMEPFVIIPAGLGMFIPLIMFQHMFKRGEFDFYAAMPVKRDRYFWGFTFAGIIAFLMIYLFIFIILAVMNFNQSFQYFLPGLVMFFTVFSSALLAVMLSKSYFVFIIILIVLNLFVFETLSIIPAVVDVNQSLYNFALRNVVSLFTPLYAIQLFDMNDSSHMIGLLPLITAAVEFVLAFFLHRLRGSEGRSSLAFPKIRYPLQYIVMFMAAFLVCVSGFGGFHFYGERSMGSFINNVFDGDSYIPLTLIVILITFIMSNMIFENSPRGVFRKIYHLITFTAGYAAFIFLIIGGLIFPNVPINFVPFESNAAVVMARSYENRTKSEYDAVYDNWQKAQQDITDYISANSKKSGDIVYFEDDDEEYRRMEEVCSEAFEEYQMWSIHGGDKEYYLRSSGVTLYLITDKDYLSYLSEKVRENGEMQNYVGWEFGYQNIVAEPALSFEDYLRENEESDDERFDKEYYFSNATILDIRFYVLSEEKIALLSDNFKTEGYDAMYSNIYRNYGEHKFDFRTFVDTEAALKEFESHTEDSFFTNDLSGIRYNFSAGSVY